MGVEKSCLLGNRQLMQSGTSLYGTQSIVWGEYVPPPPIPSSVAGHEFFL